MSKNTYQIDPAHSNIGFKVTHMMLARVSGRFTEFNASITMDGDYFETAVIKFSANAKSITTNHAERDAHLRGADFFDVSLHKKLSFISSEIKKTGNRRYKIEGFLTMHGLTNHIELQAMRSDFIEDDTGHSRVALNITGKLNRNKWDMKWNKPLQSGGILVSREVYLEIDSEFVMV